MNIAEKIIETQKFIKETLTTIPEQILNFNQLI